MEDHNHQEYEIYGLGGRIRIETAYIMRDLDKIIRKIGELHAINNEMQDEINGLRDRIDELEAEKE